MNLVLSHFLFLFSFPSVFGSVDKGYGRRLEDEVPVDIVTEFKEKNVLKDDFNPLTHEVTDSANWVFIDHEMVPLEMDELKPINVFAPNPVYIFDGKAQDAPPALSVYASEVDSLVEVSITSEGLQSVTKVNPVTGYMSSVVPIEPSSNVFVEVTPEDIDEDELRKFKVDEPMLPPSRRRKTTELARPQERQLQGCSEYRVIEVAIAYDSTFCRDAGGTEELANSAVQRVVSSASQIYQQPGLCLKVKVAAIDGFCNFQNDLYSSIVNLSVSSMAREFRRIITNDPVRRAIPRDTFHFFYGSNSGFGSVGYAYLDVLCDPNSGYGFGVNEITYSTNPALQANLFAHELGYVAWFVFLSLLSGDCVFAHCLLSPRAVTMLGASMTSRVGNS